MKTTVGWVNQAPQVMIYYPPAYKHYIAVEHH